MTLPKLADLDRQTKGRIYVVLLSSGEFKVGQSQNLRSRIGQLRSELRGRTYHPAKLVDGWYSDEHDTYRASEIRLLAFCLEQFGSPTYGAETFRGDYHAAVAQAQKIAEVSVCSGCDREMPVTDVPHTPVSLGASA